MLGAELFFEHFERALIKRFGLGVLTHITIDLGQIVRCGSRPPALRPLTFFANLKNLFRDRRGFTELFGRIEAVELGEQRCHVCLFLRERDGESASTATQPDNKFEADGFHRRIPSDGERPLLQTNKPMRSPFSLAILLLFGLPGLGYTQAEQQLWIESGSQKAVVARHSKSPDGRHALAG